MKISIFMILFLLLVNCTQKRQPQESPFSSVEESAIIDSLPEHLQEPTEEIIRRRFVKANMLFFRNEMNLSNDSTMTLPLFDDTNITLIIESIAPGEDSTYTWNCRIKKPFFGSALIITSPKIVTGTIQIHTAVFEIMPVTNDGVIQISEIDQTKFPDEGPPIEKPARKKSPRSGIKKLDVDKPELKVLVILPTPTYSFLCGSILGIDFKKILARSYTNNLNGVYNAVSNANVFAKVVFECQRYSPEGGTLSKDLDWVQSNAVVAALRDRHKADLVCLLVPSGSFCGRGYLNYPIENTDESTAFCVVKGSCALNNYSFAHETGHNLGMRHDRQTDDASTSPDCNYGSVFDIKVDFLSLRFRARTVMTYGDACDDCPRYGIYSNPMTWDLGIIELGPLGRNCNTPPTGTTFRRANNRQQLIDAAPIASNFR